MVEQFGQQALLSLIVHIMFLVIVWWAMQAFRFEAFVKNPKSPRGIVLMIVVVIAITQLVSSFFLDYLNYSRMLQYLF